MSSHKPLIIGIHGKAGHGKDTIASMIQSTVGSDSSVIVAFATPIKSVCEYLFDFTQEDMSSQEGKKKIVDTSYGYTIREILQKVGTESFRDVISPTIWTDFISRYIKSLPEQVKYVLIPDTRFINECEFVKENDGLLFKVVNPRVKPIEGGHISEADLDFPMDATVINNGGLIELRESVSEILIPLLNIK